MTPTPSVNVPVSVIAATDGVGGEAVNVKITGAGTIVSEYDALVPTQPFTSVAVTVIGNDPVRVAAPDNVPEEDRLTPAGSVPLASENVTPFAAPVCVNSCVNIVATVNVVVAGAVTVIAGQRRAA